MSHRSFRALLLAGVTFSAASLVGCELVPPTNGFDPDAPAEQQEPGSIAARVVLVDEDAAADGLEADLRAARVGLVDGQGNRVRREGADLAKALDAVTAEGGTFFVGDLPPSTYSLVVDGLDTYRAPNLPVVDLVAGAEVDLGTLTFRAVDVGVGTGVITGEVIGEATGAKTVTLFRASGDGIVEERTVTTDGAFAFSGLNRGRYALVVSAVGFTGDHRLDIDVGDTPIDFSGGSALVLLAADEVVRPRDGNDVAVAPDGTVFVTGSTLTVELTVPGGATGVRVSTRADFVDDDGAALPFTPLAPGTTDTTATLALPTREGTINLFAQFEARGAGEPPFAFTAGPFTATVVRDASPPVISDQTALRLPQDAAGVFLANAAAGESVTVNVEATDALSAVAAAAVVVTDSATAPAAPAVLTPAGGSPGLVRFPLTTNLGDDGDRFVHVFVADGAGNVSPARTLRALKDTTPPAATLRVQNANAGVLDTRVATLAFTVVDDGSDAPVAVQVGAPVGVDAEIVPFDAAVDFLVPAELVDGQQLTVQALLVDRVGNERLVEAPAVSLSLRTRAVGAALSAGVGDIVDDHAGTTVRVLDAALAELAVDVTDGAGRYELGNISEGRAVFLEASRPGWRTATVRLPTLPTVRAADPALGLDSVELSLVRATANGVARLADELTNATVHAGATIEARLSGSDRRFATTTSTGPDGSFTLRDLPVTVGAEAYRVVITPGAEGYAGTSTTFLFDAAGAVVGELGSEATPLLLERDQRAFDVCSAADPCVAAAFFNTSDVRVRLSGDANVTAVRVQVGTPFTAADEDPAFVPHTAGELIPVNLGGVDGAVRIFVQVRDADGVVGDVLEESVVRDTVPPELVDLTRRRAPGAFSDLFTNRTFIDLGITGDAGAGTVAPIAEHRLAFVDVGAVLDAVPVAGAVVCVANGLDCRMPLPGAEFGAVAEDTYRIEVWTCDAAGNCSAPVDTFVAHDVTPPSSQNGVAFTLTGDLTQVGDELVSRSTLYGASVSVGAARTSLGDAVVNATGEAVADVYAVRFSRRQDTSDAEVRGWALQPLANSVESADAALVVPPLPALDDSYDIFGQFFDAAGNATPVAPNPFVVTLRVDTTAPSIALVVAGGAAVVSDPVVNVDVVVPVGAEVPARVDFAADDGLFEPGNVVSRTFPLAPGGESFTLPPRGDGNYVVFARAFDAAGNVVERNRTILLDTTPPAINFASCTSCTLRDAQFFAATTTASLNVAASDQSGVAQLEVDVEDLDTGLNTTQLVPFSASLPITLFANTTNIVTLRAIDRAGNVTPIGTTLPIIEDERDPRIVSVTLAEGAATTRQQNVALRTVAVDDETALVRMQVSGSTDFTGVAATEFRGVEFVDLIGADGNKQVCVRVEDAAGNFATACDTIALDRAAPVGTVDVGVAVTNASSVLATLTYPADATEFALSTDPLACAAATYVATTFSPQQVSVDVGAVEGTVRVSACFKDGAGNTSAVAVSDTVLVDRTAPIASVVLDDGAAFSLDDTVAARVAVAPAADAVSLALQVNTALNCNTATYVPFTAVTTVTLPAVDATHTVFACVRDAAGNVSAAAASDQIAVDRTDPTGSVVVDGGALLAKNATVALDITRSADVVAMAVSAAALNCATATFEAFSSTRSLTFAGLDGARTVNVCLRDGAGRVTLVSDDITLDRRAPTASIAINNGAALTSTSVVNVNATFDTDAVAMALAPFPLDCNSESTPYKALASSTPLDLLSNGGTATAFACFKDAAGNTTAVNDSILVEQANNGTLVVAVNGGDIATRTRNVTVSLFAPADATQMKVVEALTLDCTSPVGYVAFQSSSSLTLAAGGAAPAEGERSVAVCVQTSSGDTLFALDTILLDTFAPTGTVAINNNAGTTARADVVLTIAKGANSPDITSFGVSSDAGTACQNFEAFSGTRAFSIAGADGTRAAFVCLLDGGGNTTVVSDTIVLDTAAPFPVAVDVAEFTTATTATVNLTFPGADTAQIAVAEGALDCLSTSAYQAAGTPVNLTLSASEGAKTIVACFKDAAGNTAQASDITTLDLFAPSGTTLINSGEAFTTNRNVVLAVTASPDTGRMALVEGAAPNCSTLASSSFVVFTPQPNVTLSAGDGQKTVHVCLEDRAGRRGSALSDAIRLDQGAPAATVSVNGGALATNRREITVAVNRAPGSEDVVDMAVAEGALVCNAANLAFGAFQSTTGLTLSAGDGNKTVTVCVRDGAGNVNTTNIAATIALDSTAPVGSVVINGGALGTTSQTVTLTLTTSPAEVGASRAIANDSIECATASFVPVASFPATVSHTLSAGDGQKNVFVCFKDAGGNASVASASIALDNADPVGAISVLDPEGNGDGFANTRDVVVRLTLQDENTSTAQVALREAATLDCTDPTLVYEPFATTKAFALANTQGLHTIAACFKDSANRVTPQALVPTASITLDDEAPTVTAFRINGVNAATVNNLVVTVTIVTTPDVTAMSIVNAATLDCATATYAPFQSPSQFTLAGNTPISVALCVRDAAGNTLAAPITRSVVVDTQAPNGSVTIANGATFTTSRSVQLTLNTSPPEVNGLRAIGNDTIDCGLATFTALGATLPTNVSHTLSVGDGIKTVFVCYKDSTGNISLATDTIQLDTVDPVGSLAILDPEGNNDGFANQTSVALALSLSPQETPSTTLMAIVEGATPNCATLSAGLFEPFAPAKTFTLSSGQTTKNLSVCFKDASGRVTPAGSVPTASITLDTIAPVATTFTVNGVVSPITNSNVVTVDVVASADVVGMAVGNGALNCSTALYGPFNSPVQHTLAGTSPVTVSLCLKDRAGNTSVTGAHTRSVIIDTVPPSPSLTINAGAAFSTSRDVSLTINTTPAESNATFALFNDIVDCSTAVFQPLGALPRTVAHTLSSVDGAKSVFVCVRDQAGNVAQTSDAIEVDTSDPVGVLTLIDPENNNDGFVNTTLFNVSIALPNEDTSTAQMAIADGSTLDCTTATYESFSSSRAISLSSTQGPRTLTACFRDEAGRVTPQALRAQVNFELDNVRPVVNDYTINGVTAPVVATPVVTVALVASADATSMAIANGTLDCTRANYVPIQSPIQHTLAGTGTVKVSLCVRDRAGNVSGNNLNEINVSQDPSAPSGTVLINSGNSFTTSTTVTLTINLNDNEPGVVRAISNTAPDCAGETFSPLPATLPETVTGHELLSGSGTRTVFVCFRDIAGNRAGALDTITVDGDAPSGAITIVDPEGDANGFANTRNVTLTINLPGESSATAEMFVRELNTVDCAATGLAYETFASTKALTLSAGEGLKKVVACFKDASGNVTDNSAVPSATIIVDTIDPTGTLSVSEGSIVLGTHFVNTTAVTATIASSDSDLVGLAISTGALNCATATFSPFSAVQPLTLPSGEGAKTINACLRDASGQTTAISKSVTVDTTAPTGTLLLDGGADFTADRDVLARVQSAETGLRVKVPATDCTAPFNIANFDGDETVTATIAGAEGTRSVGACLLDPAGNSVLIASTINLDLTDPTALSATCASCTEVGGSLFSRGADIDSDGDLDAGVLLGDVSAVDTNANGFVESVITRVDLNGDSDFGDTVLGVPETVSHDLGAFIGVPVGAADGVYVVHLAVVDAAGNESDEFDFDGVTAGIQGLAFTLDRAAPLSTSTLTLTGRRGDGTTSTTHTTTQNVDVTFTLADADIVAAFVTEAVSFAGLSARPLTEVLGAPLPLSGGDGTKTVRARLVDRAGNETTLAATASITLDTAAPVITSFSLRDRTTNDAIFSNDAVVDALTGVVAETGLEMRLVTPDNATDVESFVALAATTTVTVEDVLAQDGLKSVVVQVRDVARNTASANASINLDRSPPTLTSVSVAGGAASTRTQSVTVDINGTNATKMQIVVRDTVAATSTTSPLLGFQTQALVTLPAGNCASCKQVEVTLFDDAGNASSAVSDSIGLDTVVPSAVTLSLAGGAALTSTTTVTTSLGFTAGATEATQVALGEGIDCATAAYVALAASSPDTTKTVTLSGDDGAKVVTACFKDVAGNIATAVDGIVLDRAAPNGATIALAGGAAKTKLTAAVPVSVTFPVGLTDVTQIAVADRTGIAALNCATATYVALGSPTVSFTAATNETKTVHACFQDAAGNRSAAPSTATIALDTALNAAAVTFTVTGTPSTTNTRTPAVTVGLSGLTAEGIATVQISELATFADAAPLTVAANVLSLPFTLSGGDAVKTVRLRLVDDAGNVDTTRTQTIRLDTTPPTDPLFANGSVLINGSQSVTVAALAVAATDTGGSGLRTGTPYDLIGVSSTLCAAIGAPLVFADARCQWDGATPFTIDAVDLPSGESRLRIRALDVAGNQSNDDFFTITKDATAPSAFTVTAFPGDSEVAIEWDMPVVDADLAGFRVDYQLNPGTIASACPTTLPLSGNFAAQGPSPVDIGANFAATLTDMPNDVAVCVIVSAFDDAGNVTSSAPLSVTPYTVAPSLIAKVTGAQLGVAGDIGAVAARDGLLYIAADGEGLIEIDVSNDDCFAQSPITTCVQRKESTATLARPRAMLLHGRYAFVADETSGLRIFVVGEGAVPLELAGVSPVGNFPSEISLTGAKALAVDGSRLAVLADAGVALINIDKLYQTTPELDVSGAGSELLGKIVTPNVTGELAGTGLAVQGNRLAVGGNKGKHLWDITTPATPTEVTTDCVAAAGPTLRSVGLGGNVFFGTTTDDAFVACDMATGTVLAQSTSVRATMTVAGPYVILGGRGTYEIHDAGEDGALLFMGLFDTGVTGSPEDRSAFALEGSRAYYANGDSTDLFITNIARVRTVSPVAATPIAAVGTTAGAVVGNGYIEGFSRTHRIQRDGLLAQTGTTGTPTLLDVENGTIVGAGGTTLQVTRRTAAGGLESPVSVATTTDTFANVLVRYPYAVAVQTNGTATRVATYDLAAGAPTAPVSVQTLPTTLSVLSGQNAITYVDGRIYVAVGRNNATVDAQRGVHRLSLNGATGVLGAPALMIAADKMAGVLAHGHRVFFWEHRLAIRAVEHATLPTNFSTNTNLTVVGNEVGGPRARAVGSLLYVAQAGQVALIDVDFTTSATSSVAATATKVMRIAGSAIGGVDVVADRVLVTDDAGVTTAQLR